jgi:hypothetical protein
MIAPFFIIFFASVGLVGEIEPSLVRLGQGSFVLKAAGSSIDFPIAWDLEAGESIASSTWSATPSEAGGLTVDADSSSYAGAVTTCLVSGGVYRRVYELTNAIITSTGRTLVATVAVRIGPVGA